MALSTREPHRRTLRVGTVCQERGRGAQRVRGVPKQAQTACTSFFPFINTCSFVKRQTHASFNV